MDDLTREAAKTAVQLNAEWLEAQEELPGNDYKLAVRRRVGTFSQHWYARFAKALLEADAELQRLKEEA